MRREREAGKRGRGETREKHQHVFSSNATTTLPSPLPLLSASAPPLLAPPCWTARCRRACGAPKLCRGGCGRAYWSGRRGAARGAMLGCPGGRWTRTPSGLGLGCTGDLAGGGGGLGRPVTDQKKRGACVLLFLTSIFFMEKPSQGTGPPQVPVPLVRGGGRRTGGGTHREKKVQPPKTSEKTTRSASLLSGVVAAPFPPPPAPSIHPRAHRACTTVVSRGRVGCKRKQRGSFDSLKGEPAWRKCRVGVLGRRAAPLSRAGPICTPRGAPLGP